MADEQVADEPQDTNDDAPVIEADGHVVDDAPQMSEVEELASEMGWRPKSEWSGDDAAWKPAKDFVKATRDINRNLGRDVKDMRRQLDGIGQANARMTEAAINAERARWEAELDEATDDGDRSRVKAASAKLREIDRAAPAPAPEPDAQRFVERHADWWGKNEEATQYAVTRADHYAKQGLSTARQLSAVEADLRKHFPDVLPEAKPERKAPTVGTPSGTARPAAREKGYATLPPEARKACDAWVDRHGSKGAAFSKDAWAKNYYGDQA